MKNKIYFIILLLGLFVCTGLFAQTEEAQEQVITEVLVEGNRNISSASILSKIKTKKGKPFSQLIASDDLKRLYALGYFSDIKVDTEEGPEGVTVVFRVQELPLLSEITLAGNKSIRTEKLQELVKSKKGDFLSIHQIKQDMRDIQKAYEGRGFPGTKVYYKTELDEETNEAKIKIVVEEKLRVKIKQIYVEGNEQFVDKKILKLMRTRRDTLFTSGIYREEVLDMDMQRITQFYNQQGFLDVNVAKEESFGPEKKKMYLTIKIEEGEQYLVGEIKIEGAVIFPENEVRQYLTMRTGGVFNRDDLKYDVSSLQSFYFSKGYISAEVDVDTILNERTSKIDVLYKIKENELTYIDKIKIRGNTKTRDMVIRRELRCYPGEVYDGEKLKRSKERLYNLGFFQEVSYDTEKTKVPTRKDLVVNVKEAKTGEFAFGGGFSSVERFIGFVEIAQKNFDITNWHTFTGAGQDLRLKAEFGKNRREYDVRFTEPWIFGLPLSFGVDGYNRLRERSSSTGYSYDEERTGGDLRLGKEFTEFVRGDLMYKFEQVDISNVPSEASSDLQDEEGQNSLSSLLLRLTRDSRDNIYSPSRGLVLSCSGEVAGGPFGADKDFYKLSGTVDFYKTLLAKLLFEFKVVAAAADTYSETDSLPIYERYYAGGTSTVRGFEERMVGPKDISGEPLGGESSLCATCEVTRPLFKLIKVAAFYDIGNVWEKLGEFASGDFRYSMGGGLRVKTPMGPVKLDYGYPLKVDDGEDAEGKWHFSMSRGF